MLIKLFVDLNLKGEIFFVFVFVVEVRMFFFLSEMMLFLKNLILEILIVEVLILLGEKLMFIDEIMILMERVESFGLVMLIILSEWDDDVFVIIDVWVVVVDEVK